MATHSNTPPNISFEFFPPKTPAGREKLRATYTALAERHPSFFSVTFGAGGSTRAGTRDTVLELHRAGLEAAPHLSCIGLQAQELRAILAEYKAHGIRRILALRGDLPTGNGVNSTTAGQFRYANELVEFIRDETGDWFHIEVAAYPEVHPQAASPDADIANFARKINAGADSAITQVFYNTDAYFRFVDEVSKHGITAPIIPGIFPITCYTQLARFTNNCGAHIPRWLQVKLASFQDDSASLCAFAAEAVADICTKLIAGGAPGLHFYTMNQTAPTRAILDALGGPAAPAQHFRTLEPRTHAHFDAATQHAFA